MTIEIYTDGACRGNPGPGGWGVLLLWNSHQKRLKGFEAHTTNNRMELMAAIKALESVKKKQKIKLYTDSQYVKNGITKWIIGWKAKAWKTSNRKLVKNVELWQELEELTQKFEIEWHWVKGHSGNNGNDIADQLANAAIEEQL